MLTWVIKPVNMKLVFGKPLVFHVVMVVVEVEVVVLATIEVVFVVVTAVEASCGAVMVVVLGSGDDYDDKD